MARQLKNGSSLPTTIMERGLKNETNNNGESINEMIKGEKKEEI